MSGIDCCMISRDSSFDIFKIFLIRKFRSSKSEKYSILLGLAPLISTSAKRKEDLSFLLFRLKNFFEIVSSFFSSIKKLLMICNPSDSIEIKNFTDMQDLNFLIRNILKISNDEFLEIVKQSIPEKNPILYKEISLKIL